MKFTLPSATNPKQRPVIQFLVRHGSVIAYRWLSQPRLRRIGLIVGIQFRFGVADALPSFAWRLALTEVSQEVLASDQAT